MKKKKKRGFFVIVLFVFCLLFFIFFSSNFVPTANAIKVSGDFEEINNDPFDVLQGDLNSLNEEASEINPLVSVNNKDENENNLELDYDIIESEKDSKEKIESSFDLEEYEGSLEKIRDNYVEIENEVEKLEKVKDEIEKRKCKEWEMGEELILIKKEIELLKSERKNDKRSFSFYGFLVTFNLIILSFIFLYSRNYKIRTSRQVDSLR